MSSSTIPIYTGMGNLPPRGNFDDIKHWDNYRDLLKEYDKYYNVLTVHENEFQAGRMTEREHHKHVDTIFSNPNVLFQIKEQLASKLFRITPIGLWGLENLEGKKLSTLAHVSALKVSEAESLAKNVNLTWDICYHILRYHNGFSVVAKGVFLKNLNEEVFDKDFAFNLVSSLPNLKSINEGIVVNRLKKIFDLDPSLPNSWVLKMVQTLLTAQPKDSEE